jgi:5-methylcytosine-specific restriction endonuclease McrA
MSVFVLDKRKMPLMPCSERRARLLLERGRACVHRIMPFTIRLKDRVQEESVLQPIRVKLDPGSKVTGIALVREKDGKPEEQHVLFMAELIHRGSRIKDRLEARSSLRRRRRSQNLRYRKPRFNNRTSPKGWLPPSLLSRVDNCMSWVDRLKRWTPLTAISTELVRFDMQILENPEISGVEYQQGELSGYEVREYLLEKFNRTCAYCGKKDLPLEIEHIIPRSKGGSNRISNLTLACRNCNQAKGNKDAKEFLAKKPDLLKKILAQAKQPLKDAAAVNATRWKLFNSLKETGLPLEAGTGGRTKFNRSCFSIPKTHALDAICVGVVEEISGWKQPFLPIAAMGRGSYQRTRLDRYGFPRGYLMREKSVNGFQTGDLVKAVVPKGKHQGTHFGRVAVRKTGNFNIKNMETTIQGISWKNCSLLQRADGYAFSSPT